VSGDARRGRGLLRLVRAGDWWQFHLLPLLAAAYAAIVLYATPPGAALPALLRLLLSIVFIAAYSHVVNDAADAEQDALAGKPSRVGALAPGWRAAAALLPLACGVAVWAGAGLSARTLALLAGIVALQPLYALRPLRLKERGAWGLAADSLHTHALPTLYCFSLFADLAGASPWGAVPLAATAWSFLVGLRGILYHQRVDEAGDRLAGVSTWVTTHGSERAAALARRRVFPAELAALAVLGAALLPVAPAAVACFAGYGLLAQLPRWAGAQPHSLADPAPADRGSYVPLLAFYRTWPALAFALLLAARHPAYLTLAALHVLVFAGPVLHAAADLWELLRWTARAPAGVLRRLSRAPRAPRLR
jgi:4-hydroxybenzoate polyprenyltransferase